MTSGDDDPLAIRLDRRARRQLGLLSSADLAEAGLTPRQIDHRHTAGLLIRVRRGVYRLPGVTPSWEQVLRAAIMAGPAGSVASHLAAARLHRLRGVDSEQLEITVTGHCRLAGVQVHQTVHLHGSDVTRLRSIPVTTAARTLCDLSGVVPVSVLGRAVDECLRGDLSLTALERCEARLRELGGPRQLTAIRELIESRRDGPELGDSPLEGRVLAWLREAGLPDPATQFRFRRGRRPDERFDLAYPDLCIAIELTGWYEHGKREALEHDQSRRNGHEIAGWMVLEFADRHSRSEVIETVTRAREAQQQRLAGVSGVSAVAGVAGLARLAAGEA